MPSYAAIAPIAQHRGREPQLACDLDQRPTAARQQGDRLRLELIRKMTPFLAHSTPSRSRRSLAKVSTNSGEAHISLPRYGGRVGLHIDLFGACSAFTRVAACTLAQSPIVTANRRLQPFRYLHDCSDCFRLERIAGWGLHPLESAAFARRTP